MEGCVAGSIGSVVARRSTGIELEPYQHCMIATLINPTVLRGMNTGSYSFYLSAGQPDWDKRADFLVVVTG